MKESGEREREIVSNGRMLIVDAGVFVFFKFQGLMIRGWPEGYE